LLPDGRDLSWRLFDLKLTTGSPNPPSVPPYKKVSEWWPDNWVSNPLAINVRIDPGAPVLEVVGEFPERPGKISLKAVLPNAEEYDLFVNQPGEFVRYVPLISLLSQHADRFATIKFVSSGSFNPKRQGLSQDDRDLSWRLFDVRLLSLPAAREVQPAYYLVSEWWRDKWVSNVFEVAVLVDRSRPFLRLSGEIPSVLSGALLRVRLPDGKSFVVVENHYGRFSASISLVSLIAGFDGKYVPLEFEASRFFIPKETGISDDTRMLAWQLLDMELVENEK